MEKVKKAYSTLGPGFITGASDDDPAGIGTYSQTGAAFGFSQAWTALFTFPLMTVIQEMCGRVGLVTGRGLVSILKHHYKGFVYLVIILLSVANTFNIGADLGAMAASAQLIVPLPFQPLLLIFTLASVLLQVFIPYKVYARYLKYLTFFLLSYIVVAFVIKIDWGAVFLSTFIPHIAFTKNYLFNIVAIFGTTISPYLFFWQTSEEVEEEIKKDKLIRMGYGKPKIYSSDLKQLRLDTIFGMFFSNLIMWFIIIATGATLFQNGIHTISSADQAAEVLKPIAGDFASLLFAIGIIGTGLLAVPILAGSCSYAISEAFGWHEGLYLTFSKAKGFYIVIIASMFLGMAMNFLGLNPISALYYSAVLNGLIAPILIFIILAVANNHDIMGKRKNGTFTNIVGFSTGILMSIFAALLLGSFFIE